MPRELEPWGGEVHVPHWLKRLLRRSEPPGDTPEHLREARHARAADVSVIENADRANVGALSQFYREGRAERRATRGASAADRSGEAPRRHRIE